MTTTSNGTVSGRTYVRTRPRGFAPWNPKPQTAELVDQVRAILDEYRPQLPMTARQVFYVLVGRYGYDKTERAYARLLETLNRARRARLVPMWAIRDDGGAERHPGGWPAPASFWDAVTHTARNYTHDPADGQPVAVEVWVEAAGMLPQVGTVAVEYGASVYSSGGFDSVTVKHAAAERMARRGVPTVVLHLGDHDPSGNSIVDSAAEDVVAFAQELGAATPPAFARLGVTEEQARRYRLASAPQKDTDRRGEHMAHTYQAEAMTPDQLAAEVRAALERHVDLDALAVARELGEQERAEVLRRLATLRE